MFVFVLICDVVKNSISNFLKNLLQDPNAIFLEMVWLQKSSM